MEKLFALVICVILALSGCTGKKKSKCNECPTFSESHEKLERVKKI